MPTPKLIYVTLGPEWAPKAGQPGFTSYLLSKGEKRKQCCVGVALTQAGIQDKDIEGRQTAVQIFHLVKTSDPIVDELERLSADYSNSAGSALQSLYTINDAWALRPKTEIVKELNAVLIKAKSKLRFKLGEGVR
jgi:hypothetical protein